MLPEIIHILCELAIPCHSIAINTPCWLFDHRVGFEAISVGSSASAFTWSVVGYRHVFQAHVCVNAIGQFVHPLNGIALKIHKRIDMEEITIKCACSTNYMTQK